VTGDEGAHVLDPDIALDGGDHEVAELAADGDDDADSEEVRELIDFLAAEGAVEEEGDEGRGKKDGARLPARVLPGLVLGASLRRPRGLPTQKAMMSLSCTVRRIMRRMGR
jgi:hypothetical protein